MASVHRIERSKAREALLLACAFLITAGLGQLLTPTDDPPITFTNYLRIDATLTATTYSPVPVPNRVRLVNWTEAHTGISYLRERADGKPSGELRAGDIRVGVDFFYQNPLDTEADFLTAIRLLGNAEIHNCAISGRQAKCEVKTEPSQENSRRFEKEIVANSRVQAGMPEVAVSFDVSNLSGLAFATSGKTTRVRFPALRSIEPYAPKGGWIPLEMTSVQVDLAIDHARDIRWNQAPTGGVNRADSPDPGTVGDVDSVSWRYDVGDRFKEDGASPYISGINQALEEKETHRVFWSGIAFGTATATLIAALQSLLVGLSDARSNNQRRKHRS